MQEAVELKTGDSPIVVGRRLETLLHRHWKPAWRTAVIIGDSNTVPLFAERIARALEPLTVRTLTLSFEAGEAHKTRDTKAALEDAMLLEKVDRSACVVALGGGIACDLAGFVAATYMRGIPHVNYATTLLAQVDAAHGGKTGVNTPAGKNLVGAFHLPYAVFADLDTLATLPPTELRSGLAECIKHAVIASEGLFERWEAWDPREDHIPPLDLLRDSIAVKSEVVARDPQERSLRKVLNFGHTIAHAIEMGTDHTVSHGFAVAAGMVVEARIAQEVCGFPAAQVERLIALLKRCGLPTVPQCLFGDAVPYFAIDKKNQSAQIHCALPQRLGTMFSLTEGTDSWTHPVELTTIARYWH